MNCQHAEKWILLQDSGELSNKHNNALAAHLHDCAACQQFQFALIESQNCFQTLEEPSIKAVQNILREARVNTPSKKRAAIWALKPAIAVAASLVVALGFFFSSFGPDKVGMELVVTETQLLNASDQISSVMYSGYSDDDLAFNFLMTYEDSYASL
jgi:anti-sigma factor RsiW